MDHSQVNRAFVADFLAARDGCGPGAWDDFRFVVAGTGVAAVVVRWEEYGDVRFDRKAE